MASSTPVRRRTPARTPVRSAPATSRAAKPAASKATAQRPAIQVVPASVPRRLLGGLLDSVLILVIVGLIWSRVAPSSVPVQVRIDAQTGERIVLGQQMWTPDWLGLLSFTVAAVYLITFIALAGRTPGGWAVGIRCIRADTGGRPGWSVSARRWFVLLGIPASIGLLPVIGPWAWLLTLAIALSPLLDRSGRMQGFHDRFAGDLVVLDRGAVK